MKKQTAVEWLVDELRMRYDSGALDAISISILKLRAKEMEKEQISIAYQSDRIPCSDEDAEQYYNETYK
jgi:hypothetical protein